MFFLIKLLFYLVIIVMAIAYVVNHSPTIKSTLLEFINPIAKENLLFAELQKTLDSLGHEVIINNKTLPTAERDQKLETQKQLLAKSQQLVIAINQEKAKHSGLLDTTISRIVDFVSSPPIIPTSAIISAPLSPSSSSTSLIDKVIYTVGSQLGFTGNTYSPTQQSSQPPPTTNNNSIPLNSPLQSPLQPCQTN